MSLLTVEALEEATRELFDAVGAKMPTAIYMRKDKAEWVIAVIKQRQQVKAARRHPMLRHMTKRQFDRRVRVKEIPYPKVMPSNWMGWSA